MTKKLWIFPFIILIIITLLAGCGGSTSDYRKTKQGADQLITAFETAVESYTVTDMLGCLSGNDFSLIIREAGFENPKTYTKLAEELDADKTNQQNWRLPVSGGGHAYVLNLDFGEIKYSNTTASGTYANHTFEVWESASDVQPPIPTDKGMIFWTIIKDGVEWKATEMTIEYQNFSGSGFSAKHVSSSSRGFGFSTLKF